jgi:hypothetical protein
MKLIGIYPTAVADLTYDATANGNVVTMNVTLAYQYWVADDSLSIGKSSGGSFASMIA